MNKRIKPVAAAIGAAFAGSMVAAGSASASANPFALTELNGGYTQTADAHQGKCGAGKCGGTTPKGAEHKCGAGKCGGTTAKDAEAKGTEGKCGAGKCGGTMTKGAEHKCGAGKCGGAK